MASFLQKCPACKKKRLYIRKWKYTDKSLPSGSITTDKEICAPCHDKIRAMVLHRWSIRHYLGYAIMRLKNIFYGDTK